MLYFFYILCFLSLSTVGLVRRGPRALLLRYIDIFSSRQFSSVFVSSHQFSSVLVSRQTAGYCDGRNEFGEQAASGVYYYTIAAGDYLATSKMLLLK